MFSYYFHSIRSPVPAPSLLLFFLLSPQKGKNTEYHKLAKSLKSVTEKQRDRGFWWARAFKKVLYQPKTIHPSA